MGLTFVLNLVLIKTLTTTLILTSKLCVCMSMPYTQNINISDIIPCPDYGSIEFATIKSFDIENSRLHVIHVECNVGYELMGRPKLLCNNGKWESAPRPECIPMCQPPPNIENGRLSLEGDKDRFGYLKKGTLATYYCNAGYQLSPPESKYRVCEKGIWIGATAICASIEQITSCKRPKDIANGYYVKEKNNVVDGFGIGQRLHYSCNSGFILDGSSMQQCLEDGTWSPRIPPNCIQEESEPDADGLPTEIEDYFLPCPLLPIVSHATMKVIRGGQGELQAAPDTVVEYRCDDGYRTTFTQPCEQSVLRCKSGVWLGEIPSCVPVKGCTLPPNISNGVSLGVLPTGVIGQGPANDQSLGSVARYPVGVQVLYQCLPGYVMHGSRLLRCSSTGCWEPEHMHPTCLPDEQLLVQYMSTSGTLLVSIATASGVMLFLLAVCLVVICRRRKPWGRRPLAAGVSVGGGLPHHQMMMSHHHHHHMANLQHAHHVGGGGGGGGDSAGDQDGTVMTGGVNDPDRLALIAFADGMQATGYQQSGLPSYEEAIRERTAPGNVGLLGFRPHRAHWTVLGATRRPRPSGGGQQPPDSHVTRQSSCTSHTASMRSGSAGDPMGSTDTMTPSEVSTNVTLDTVSSHSGSQPASCRAICGSLASFDTSSALNTEGVPLLEENETEETLIAETSSIGVDHRSIADNASFKYRRASPDLA